MPRRDKKAYNEYMREYMKTYRAYERELIKQAKKAQGIPEDRRQKSSKD